MGLIVGLCLLMLKFIFFGFEYLRLPDKKFYPLSCKGITTRPPSGARTVKETLVLLMLNSFLST
jgi:hypothetical protein